MSSVVPKADRCHPNKEKSSFGFSRSWKDCSLLILCCVISSVIFFQDLGRLPLFNPDEGLYAEPAREMLDTGEYITTLLNYAVRFTKPPLIIWAMALGYKIFGVNEFAARFFCALSAVLLIISTYLFSWKYFGRATAVLSAAILLTAPLFIGVGRMAITDMPLSLFTALCLFSFFHGWQQRKKVWIWIGYFCAGLAVMTKGPVGVILPALILGTYFLLCAPLKEAIRFLHMVLGSVVVAVVSLPWFITEIAITHGAYFREFIMRENFARFTSVVDSHKGGWWYHLAAVFGGLFPWSILLPQAFIEIASSLPFQVKPTTTSPAKSSGRIQHWLVQQKEIVFRAAQNFRSLDLKKQTLFFLSLWAVFTIAFYSISVSKLLPYTLPAFPALAIIIANQWNKFIAERKYNAMFVYCILILLFFTFVIGFTPLALRHLRNAPLGLGRLITGTACSMGLCALIAFSYAIRRQVVLASVILFGSATFVVLIVTPKILNQVSQFWEGAVPDYARFVRQEKQPLIVYRLRKPAVPFYYRARVLQVSNTSELQKILKTQKSCYLIAGVKDLSSVQSNDFKLVRSDTNFALLQYRHD